MSLAWLNVMVFPVPCSIPGWGLYSPVDSLYWYTVQVLRKTSLLLRSKSKEPYPFRDKPSVSLSNFKPNDNLDWKIILLFSTHPALSLEIMTGFCPTGPPTPGKPLG